MHQDALSLRAKRCLPALLDVLMRHPIITNRPIDLTMLEVSAHLRAWDGRMEPDRVGASIFEVFFSFWTGQVMEARLPDEAMAFLASGAANLAAELLVKDRVGWFPPREREQAILAALFLALNSLSERLGPDMAEWKWGRLHVLKLRHILSGRGDLGRLLNRGGLPVRGNAHTVCNTASGGNFEVRTGANYRLIADLDDSPAGLWAVDSQGQSGHPGSPHYGEGLTDWIAGRYHFLPLDGADTGAGGRLVLSPVSST
jgi:penicillin amidase